MILIEEFTEKNCKKKARYKRDRRAKDLRKRKIKVLNMYSRKSKKSGKVYVVEYQKP